MAGGATLIVFEWLIQGGHTHVILIILILTPYVGPKCDIWSGIRNIITHKSPHVNLWFFPGFGELTVFYRYLN